MKTVLVRYGLRTSSGPAPTCKEVGTSEAKPEEITVRLLHNSIVYRIHRFCKRRFHELIIGFLHFLDHAEERIARHEVADSR